MSGMDDNKLKRLLAKRTKVELVEWIMEQAADNESVRRALVTLVAPQADTVALASELNQIIKEAWARAQNSREPWKLARPIVADLEPVLSAVQQMIEQGQAVAAEKLLRRFIAAGDKGLDQVDDSNGYLGPLCQEAVALWGKAWAKIEPREPNALAKVVYDGVRDDGYAIRDHMIHDFAEALGTEGLLVLKEMFWAEYQANLTRKSMDDWDRREPLRHLADVADALGDVDMYIDTQRRCDVEDVYAMPIARRLLKANRADEALDYLNRADPSRSHFHGEPDDYITLQVKILQALGRNEDARNTLWREFERTLSTAILDRLLSLTAKDQQQAMIDKAIAAAEIHADKLAVARFLLERGHPDRAAAIIGAHPEQFDGRYYGHLLPLAKALQEEFPASAWVLYRSLLLNILEQKRSKAYHHAADYLTMASELAEKAGMSETYRTLLTQLQSQHGRKSAFWRLVQK